MDKDKKLIVPELRTSESPRIVLLKQFPKMPLNISGGWGYSAKDVVVIEDKKKIFGYPTEDAFIQLRTIKEVINILSDELHLDILGIKRKMQFLLTGEKGQHYDKISFEVSVMVSEKNKALIEKFKSNNEFQSDPKGYEAFKKEFDLNTIKYEKECWFVITNFF